MLRNPLRPFDQRLLIHVLPRLDLAAEGLHPVLNPEAERFVHAACRGSRATNKKQSLTLRHLQVIILMYFRVF